MATTVLLLALVSSAVCDPFHGHGDIDMPQSVSEGDVIHELIERHVTHGLPKSSSAFKISLGLYVDAVTEVDVVKEVVEVKGFLSMMWTDPRLRFRYSLPFHPIRVVRLPTSHLWWPDVELFNGVSPGLTVMNMRDEVTVDFNGTVRWYPLANMRSLCEELGNGNKSEVQCSLRFGSWSYTSDFLDLVVQQPGAILSEYTPTGQWIVTDASVHRTDKKFECCPDLYAIVTFVLTLKKKDA